jgi:hypothetical protein
MMEQLASLFDEDDKKDARASRDRGRGAKGSSGAAASAKTSGGKTSGGKTGGGKTGRRAA